VSVLFAATENLRAPVTSFSRNASPAKAIDQYSQATAGLIGAARPA
jgi:hypothetical protein